MLNNAMPSSSSSKTHSRLWGILAIAAILSGMGAYTRWRLQPSQSVHTPTTKVSTLKIKTVTALGRLEPKGTVIKLSAPTGSNGNQIGAIARPDEIRFTEQLPKTRSGKIMRRLLRSIASGEEIAGDMSTLEDRSVLDKLRGS